MKQVLKMVTKYGKTVKILKKNSKLPIMRMMRFAMPVEMLGNVMSVKETDDLIQLHFSDADNGKSYWTIPLREGATITCGYGTAVVHTSIAKQNKEFPDSFVIVEVLGSCGIAKVTSRDYVDMTNNERFGKASFLVFHQNANCYETTREGYARLDAAANSSPGALYDIVDASRAKAIAEEDAVTNARTSLHA